MIGWHHQLNGQEFEQTLGHGEVQGSLACCCLWGHKESETIEQLNSNFPSASSPLQLVSGNAATACGIGTPSTHVLTRLFSFNFLRSVFIYFRHASPHAGSQFPTQGLNPSPLHWEHRVLISRPTGKFTQGCLYCIVLSFQCPGRCLGRIVRMQQHHIICQHPKSSESGCDDTKRYWPHPRAAHNLSHLR